MEKRYIDIDLHRNRFTFACGRRTASEGHFYPNGVELLKYLP